MIKKYKYKSNLVKRIPNESETFAMIEELLQLLPMNDEQIICRAVEKYYLHHKYKISNQNSITAVQLWLKQDKKCFYCKKPIFRKEITIDHVEPLAKGGLWNMENLVCACEECNLMKGDMTLQEFYIFMKTNLIK